MNAAYRLGGWRRDSNDDDDRTHLEAVRARLARIKVNRATRRVGELEKQWPDDPANVLETLLLRQRLANEQDNGHVE